MEKNTLKAKVKSTGEEIVVYNLKKGGYAEYPGCKREFRSDEIEIMSK